MSAIALMLLTLTSNASADRILAACTDYGTGMLSSMEAAHPWTAYSDELSIHSDAVLRWGGDYLVLVERFGVDAVRVLEPETLALVGQFSTGTASNPQDIIVIGEKAYVTCNNRNEILVVAWPSGTLLDTVDLSAWADADGSAEIGNMILAEGLIFIAVGRLDRDFYWLPVGDSYLAVLDPESDSLVDVNPGQAGLQAIELPATNPAGEMHEFEGHIWLSCPASYGLEDGGLVRVEPSTFTAELLIPESQFAGDLGDFGFVDATHAWAIVADAAFHTHLYRFDPSGIASPSLALAGMGWDFSDLEIYGGSLFLADQSWGGDGVRVLDAATGEELAGPVDLGLPPYDLLAPPGGEVNAPELPARFVRLDAWPNPFNPSTTIRMELEEASVVSLEIFDSSGRRVRTLVPGGILEAGSHEVRWDGMGSRGEALPSGIYHARLDAAGRLLGRKLVLIK